MSPTHPPEPPARPTRPESRSTEPPPTVGDTGLASASSFAESATPHAGMDQPGPQPPYPRRVRFSPVRFHARGGLGEVFLASDEELHREVALKRIQDRFADDAESVYRFLLEAEITGRLEHPGVVPVHGLEHDAQGRPCYAMRFIRGETFQEAIKRLHEPPPGHESPEPAWTLRQLLGRFVTVCNTVAYAHSRGIIHRDIKPANIMLGPFGETLVVDWGLAKETGKSRIDEHHSKGETVSREPQTDIPAQASVFVSPFVPRQATQEGQVIGTPAFMSPEQAAGKWNLVGPASDIYSLGATLYVLLTGQPPFSGAFVDVLEQVQQGDFRPPRHHAKHVSPALESICLKAMSRRPEERYASALDLAGDLENWLADEPVAAYPEPFRVRAGRWLKRHRTIVLAGVSLLATAVVFLTIIAVLINQARQRSLTEQAQTALEYQRAEQERYRARTNLQRALKSVDQMLTRVGDERLASLPEFDDERREILQEALALYRELMDENSTEPEAQLETAKAYTRLGDLHHLLGHEAEAARAYGESVNLLQALTKAHPDVMEYTAALAHAEDQHGLLYWASDDPAFVATARAAFERAVPLWERVVQAQPGRRDSQSQLAMDYYRLAMHLSLGGQAEQSETVFLKSLELQKDLVRADAGDEKSRATLGSIYNSFGSHYLRTERWTEAEAACRQALPLFTKLAAAQPRVVKYQYELSYSWNTIGVVCAYTGRSAHARAAYSKSMALLETILRNHPKLTAYQGEMADNLEDWAGMYQKKDWLVEAEAEYRKALGRREAMLKIHPDNSSYARNVAVTCNRLGLVQTQLRKSAAAHDCFRQAIAIRAKLLESQPVAEADQIALSEVYVNRGDLLREEGKTTEARESYRQAELIVDSLAKQATAHQATRPLLSRLHLGLALLEIRLHRAAEAEPHWHRAMDLAEQREQAAFRVARARELARAGNHEEAVKILDREEGLSGALLGELARGWSLASAAVRVDQRLPAGERARRAEVYAARAIALLDRVRAADSAEKIAGHKWLLDDPDFDALRSTPGGKKGRSLIQE